MAESSNGENGRGALSSSLRYWLVFLLLFGAFQVFIFKTPWIWQNVSEGTAQATAWLLRLLGAQAQARGTSVQSSVYSINVVWECTGVFPIALFAAAVLAYPCGFKAKAAGVVLGIPLLFAVNLVRLVTLCYAGREWPDRFETIHLLVWQSLFVFCTLLVWILWAVVAVGRYERRRA